MKVCVLISWLFATALAVSTVHGETPPAQIAWRLLDYIAVDYPGAVQDSKVISDAEFAEMTEFAASARERIHAMPASSAKADLLRRAGTLQALIASNAPAAFVAITARSIAADLIEAYPVPLAPANTPVFERGHVLFAQNCASCHGMSGDGMGPASIGLQPPPIAFSDKERARERSIFALYQVIEQGIDGTSMASFAGMPPQDRWDLALYISTIAYPASTAVKGEQIWSGDSALRAKFNMVKLVGMTPASLEAEIGEAKADAVTAYLRRKPAAVLEPTTGSLTLARTRLAEALTAYAKGDRKGATDLALTAYLDGFEPIEPILSARDNALKVRVESAMGALRSSITEGRSPDEVRIQIATLDALLTDVESALASGEASAGSSFIAAFTVLLREGLEAVLIVVMMMAFVRKAGRSDMLPYAHGGWVAALVAGGLTWIIATYFINISGANRELTEGFSSVFAAIVLLWVGVWMHGKNSSDAWQRYVCDKLNHALNNRSAWFLFGFSFFVVYREVFETILFYIAIWNHGNGGTVLLGGAAAIVALFVIAWVMLRYSRTLPLNRFFFYSSGLIAVLAVILIGKGVAALQEAGYLLIHPLAGFPRIAAFGLFPTREGIIAQVAMIALLLIGLGYSTRKSNKHKKTTA